MIKSFKHKGLSRFFIKNDKKLLPSQHIDKISRQLDRLDTAEVAEDMNIPGYYLHPLKGKKANLWSIRVTGNWRITFRFEAGHAHDVNLEDYH